MSNYSFSEDALLNITSQDKQHNTKQKTTHDKILIFDR